MYDEMFEEENIQLNLDQSTILVKLTPTGEAIMQRLNSNGTYRRNEDGYYEVFTTDLFKLYRSYAMRNQLGEITDIIDGPVLIPSTFLLDQEGRTIRCRQKPNL